MRLSRTDNRFIAKVLIFSKLSNGDAQVGAGAHPWSSLRSGAPDPGYHRDAQGCGGGPLPLGLLERDITSYHDLMTHFLNVLLQTHLSHCILIQLPTIELA